MAYFKTQHVTIKGIAACVPREIADNLATSAFKTREEAEKFINSTGVRFRRVVDNNTTTADLCYKAAEQLLQQLKWERESIDCLIFVSQTPDYILPATSCILQHRLGLPTSCYALDISLGCSGWVYGMSLISMLLNSGFMKRGLLLTGDTSSLMNSETDKSTRPMFGDAGTATALEFNAIINLMHFLHQTDGEGAEAIMIRDGGFRHVMSPASFEKHYIEDGIERTNRDLVMDGMDVFAFSISKAPQAVNEILKRCNMTRTDIDYFTFHQANFSMNEIIRKKLLLKEEQVKYSLNNFGNTSSASIPLTLVIQIQHELREHYLKHIACGFGVGFSWGVTCFETDHIICPDLIEF